MISYIIGDLLEADVEAVVNTVNTVGVMGKGIALQFKDKYPNNLNAYLAACKSGEMIIGKMLVFKESEAYGGKIIINFPTKKDWKHKSKYEYIEKGLKDLVKVINEYNIKSIAIPPLGCGNGGLEWDKIKSLMEKYLGTITSCTDIFVFEPNEKIKGILKKQESSKEVKLTDAKALLLYSMFYYESQGEFTSLFVANKLAYFFQRLKEPSFQRLKFTKSHYGPYSRQVDHLIHGLNGKYLRGMEQMTLTAFEPIELQYDKVSEVSGYVKKIDSERLKRLLHLINGFQSAFSLEILASVDFIRKENKNISKEETVTAIRQWSERKKDLFKEEYISIAYDHLEKYASSFLAESK